jgi:FKBP-type peptidyl-prolyl cis-trans isomerase
MRINWSKEVGEITMGADNNSTIRGFAQTLSKMKSMEKGVGVFYSTIGYGYSGSGDNIPAYAPLIFEIELVAKPEE